MTMKIISKLYIVSFQTLGSSLFDDIGKPSIITPKPESTKPILEITNTASSEPETYDDVFVHFDIFVRSKFVMVFVIEFDFAFFRNRTNLYLKDCGVLLKCSPIVLSMRLTKSPPKLGKNLLFCIPVPYCHFFNVSCLQVWGQTSLLFFSVRHVDSGQHFSHLVRSRLIRIRNC